MLNRLQIRFVIYRAIALNSEDLVYTMTFCFALLDVLFIIVIYCNKVIHRLKYLPQANFSNELLPLFVI